MARPTLQSVQSFFIAVLLICSVFAWNDKALAQDAPGPSAPAGEIAVGSNQVEDQQIEERIGRILAQMQGYEGVRVSVSSGVVTLAGEVVDAAAEDTLLNLVNRIEGVVTIESEVEQASDLDVVIAPAVERLLARAERMAAGAPLLLAAVLAFAAITTAGWLLTGRFRFWDRIAPNTFIADIYRTVGRIAFAVVGLVVALDILNATALIGAVLGAAGVVGLAVGFAVRDTVENFIASVLLSLRQPFRPNDVVEIEGDLGSVARLTSRATILISPDGNQIRIPNATVFKGRIINYTRDPQRRFVFTLGVASETDLAKALSTGAGSLSSLPFVLKDPPVSAWIEDVGDSSVALSFAGWADQTRSDFLKARGEAIRAVKTALEEAGIDLPEPTYRLKIDGRKETEDGPHRPAREDVLGMEGGILPEAAAPDHAGLATERVLERERGSADTAPDLLNHRREAE